MTNIVHKSQLILDTDELPIIWVNEINIEKSQEFVKDIIKLESDPEVFEIYVFISGYGGDVFAVLSMVEAMTNCKKPVHTVGLGLCASGDGILLAAGTGKRWLTSNSFLHIHHIQTTMSNDLPGIENDVVQTKKVEDKIFSIITKRTEMTVKKLRDKLVENRREWQMSARQAKSLGFIDEIGLPTMKKFVTIEVD